MRLGKKVFKFNNKENVLSKHSGIYITMNPSSKEYGGRSELP